jgi:hypothetical protein
MSVVTEKSTAFLPLIAVGIKAMAQIRRTIYFTLC